MAVCLLATILALGAPHRVLYAAATPGDLNNQTPFSIGERLLFLVEWKPPWYLFFLPPMEAGEAEIHVSEGTEYKGRKVLKLEFTARSSGTLVKMVGMKIDDHFKFITDAETFCTYSVSKKEREGKRKRDIEVTYLPETHQLHIRDLDVSINPPKIRKDLIRNDIPECVKDLFSALYFTRHRAFHAGLKFRSMVGDNDRVKEVEARVEKVETIHTPAGTFSAWRVSTVALVGGLFKEGGQFRMWLTDDDKKVPVQFEAKVSIGTVAGKLKSGQY